MKQPVNVNYIGKKKLKTLKNLKNTTVLLLTLTTIQGLRVKLRTLPLSNSTLTCAIGHCLKGTGTYLVVVPLWSY